MDDNWSALDAISPVLEHTEIAPLDKTLLRIIGPLLLFLGAQNPSATVRAVQHELNLDNGSKSFSNLEGQEEGRRLV